MRRVFISCCKQKYDQACKEELLRLNADARIFINSSICTDDIDGGLEPEEIRALIREKYLNQSTVTLLIVGKQTRYKKHIDWELQASMHHGSLFGKSGVVVLLTPDCESEYFTSPFPEIKDCFYPHVEEWTTITSSQAYEHRFPYLPHRIIDSLLLPGNNISVSNWKDVIDHPERLRLLIECAHHARARSKYDMRRDLRLRDHVPGLRWM